MSDSFIGFDILGIPELKKFLDTLPDELIAEINEDALEYLQNVMRNYPPYQYVSRRRAYPEVGGWFSDKQRRYVMAKIRSGEITPGQPNRTQRLANGWQVLGSGSNAILVNEVPYGQFVQGDGTQARQPALVGWRTVNNLAQASTPRIEKIAEGLAKRRLK